MKRHKANFAKESDLCAAFISALPDEWTAYPECKGWDILLSRNDGVQVGIEAKLTLNAKVISQTVEDYWDVDREGPDYRAVLIPYGTAGSMGGICRLLALTVIEMKDAEIQEIQSYYSKGAFRPTLPRNDVRYWGANEEWYDWAPLHRIELPDYVPDVEAGHAAPVRLTDWKIKAIKIAIIVEKRGWVSRADFKHIQIDHRRWLEPYVGWLRQGEHRGTYIAGPRIGDFKAQHPVNYEQIAADYEKWRPKDDTPPHSQMNLV